MDYRSLQSVLKNDRLPLGNQFTGARTAEIWKKNFCITEFTPSKGKTSCPLLVNNAFTIVLPHLLL